MSDIIDPVAGGAATTPTTVSGGSTLSSIRSSLTNFSSKRLDLAGFLGGASTARDKPANVRWQDSAGRTQTSGASGNDWRLRVSVAHDSKILNQDVNNFLLAPLYDHQGVIFPITPTINVTHTARYNSSALTHSNYSNQFYEGSEVGEIAINGEFPIQNSMEGAYLLAVIYFFRSATKMFWGKDQLAGTPPPLLYLDGYGSHYFPHVPCVLKSFTHSLPADVDYMECTGFGSKEVTRLPTNSQIQISLQPVYSRSKISTFSATDFASGKMLGGGFI